MFKIYNVALIYKNKENDTNWMFTHIRQKQIDNDMTKNETR